MKKIGIIAEYNPFHYGHQFQINQVRQKYPDALIVIAMSGNVVQRGEFAIIDKWTRSQLAVQAGADLVLELPLLASMQSADYFARWSVDLLGKLAIDELVFGTESASSQEIQRAGDWLNTHQTSLDQWVRRSMQQGHSYAFSMQAAIDQLDDQHTVNFNPSLGNHVLALKYYQWIQTFDFPMDIWAIPRQPDYLSGSHIRQSLAGGCLAPDELPDRTFQALKHLPLVYSSDFFKYLKVQILTKTPQALSKIQSVREGIEYLLIEQLDSANQLADYIQRLTSRRWTQASIQRILLNILLNIQQEEWTDYQELYQHRPVVRILAYNHQGQAALKDFKRTSPVHLFSNLSQELYPSYQLVHRADRMYQLANAAILEQNIGRYPYKYEEL